MKATLLGFTITEHD